MVHRWGLGMRRLPRNAPCYFKAGIPSVRALEHVRIASSLFLGSMLGVDFGCFVRPAVNRPKATRASLGETQNWCSASS